jgi:hypothetical protein
VTRGSHQQLGVGMATRRARRLGNQALTLVGPPLPTWPIYALSSPEIEALLATILHVLLQGLPGAARSREYHQSLRKVTGKLTFLSSSPGRLG